MRSLGSRVLPEIEPTSLAAWVAREPDLRELSMERMLHEACAAMQRYLRIDGCALVTFDPQEARAVAGVGTLGGTVAATVPALDLEPVRTAGVCALDESDLIVLGSAAAHGLDRVLHGDLADDLVLHARCSLLIVPADARVDLRIPEPSLTA